MFALPIELPEQCFGGLPLDWFHPTLEREDFKGRAPFFAPEGVAIVSRDMPVTASTPPLTGNLAQITDGDKECHTSSMVILGKDEQWVQIDLGVEHEIYAVIIWHIHYGKHVCFDVKVKIADEATFESQYISLFDNHYVDDNNRGPDNYYIERYDGKLIDAKGMPGRYVRCYSNGYVRDENNPYIEVEVWGKPTSTPASEDAVTDAGLKP